MKFVRWHVHSINSTRDSMIKIPDLVSKAKENNELVALTDHGSIGGWVEYLNECKNQNILPIIGIEAYVNNFKHRLLELSSLISTEKKSELKKQYQEERDNCKQNFHLVLVAKNNHGMKNLIKLNNLGYVNGFYNKPLVTYNEIFSLPKDKNGDRGIIVSSACLGGSLAQYILKAQSTKNKKYLLDAEEFIKLMSEEFKDDFYIEVQSNDIPEQKKVNKELLKLAEKFNISVCVGMDSHYLTEKAADTHQDLLLLQNKQTKSDVGKFDIKITWENVKGEIKSRKVDADKIFRKGVLAKEVEIGNTFGKGKQKETITNVEKIPRVWSFSTDKVWYKSEEELRKEIKKHHKELVPKLDEIIECNKQISKKIKPVSFDSEIKLPITENANGKLTEILKQKMKEKKVVKKEYIERVKTELNILKENDFCNYFLILADVITFAKENSIPLGCARGSAGGSLVGYLLDIHRIDPLKDTWGGNMPFERFLSSDRNSQNIILYNEKGKKKIFKELDEVKIIRDDKKITIQAKEIQEGDQINE